MNKKVNKADKYYVGTLLSVFLLAGICFIGPAKLLAIKLIVLNVAIAIIWPIVEYIIKFIRNSPDEESV